MLVLPPKTSPESPFLQWGYSEAEKGLHSRGETESFLCRKDCPGGVDALSRKQETGYCVFHIQPERSRSPGNPKPPKGVSGKDTSGLGHRLPRLPDRKRRRNFLTRRKHPWRTCPYKHGIEKTGFALWRGRAGRYQQELEPTSPFPALPPEATGLPETKKG